MTHRDSRGLGILVGGVATRLLKGCYLGLEWCGVRINAGESMPHKAVINTRVITRVVEDERVGEG